MSSKHYVSPYPCDPKEPCYCGGNKPFGKCCGLDSAVREPPQGVIIIPEYLAANECRRLVRYADKQKGQWLMVLDEKKSSPGRRIEKKDPARITQQVDMSKHSNFINDLFKEGLQRHAVPLFGPLDWFEWPYLLRYKPGGKYGAHSDAEQLEKATGRYYKAQDRDVSMLLYLNDDYSGGELTFTNLNYTYTPRMGDLVMFPSGTLFKHRARTIDSGRKYALVSWASLRSSPKLFPQASASPRLPL